MQPPHKILVPVDFTESSRSALELAATLGSRLGATVDMLHVWPVQREPGSRQELLLDFVRSDPGHTMMEWLASCEQRGDLDAHGRVATGERGAITDTIVETVKTGDYDLVVMATHGRQGLSLLLRGSVADEVVKRAPCPVLTVRAADEEEPPPPTGNALDPSVWSWPS